MVKVFCDKCGCDCELNAYDVRVNVIHNPVPFGCFDLGEPHLTDDTTRIRFTLCQKCYRDMGMPNPYEVRKGKQIDFSDVLVAKPSKNVFISFTAIDENGAYCEYDFSTLEEMKEDWWSDDTTLPAGESPIADFEINGVPMYVDEFDDIVALLGLEKGPF